MDFEEFKEMMKTQPASIDAKCDENCQMNLEMEGRNKEILALSLGIAETVCEKTDFPVDVFCKILKDKNELKTKMNKKKQNDMEKIINALLGDL
jgi:hypothetical protein